MEDNVIVSALIGLVGACNNNPKTENTDRVIIKALAFPTAWQGTGDETLQALIDEIHTEKYTIAPNCAVCQTPCGNTSDYDMNRIYGDASFSDSMEIFYKVLAYISFDMGRDGLFTFWNEIQKTIEKIRRQIQE